jgi:hypothetical protein
MAASVLRRIRPTLAARCAHVPIRQVNLQRRLPLGMKFYATKRPFSAGSYTKIVVISEFKFALGVEAPHTRESE